MSRLVVIASILALTAASCSGESEHEVGGIPEDPPRPDGGLNQGRPDAEADADDLDASDEDDVLVPNDADRDGQGGECFQDDACVLFLNPGPCEKASCVEGYCVKEALPDGTSCDDGNACTSGDACKAGQCSFAAFDPNAPGCLQDPKAGGMRFTEVMGNPANDVDPVEGQWFELHADAAYRLKGLKLVYYEWDGEQEPTVPSAPVIETIETEHGEAGPMVFLRSQDVEKNRWGSTPWGYSNIVFSRTRNARLMLVASSWNGAFPVPDNLVLADLELAAGTFSDDYKGRSWQRSSNPENDEIFCHSPMEEALEYWNGNFATPFRVNVECP